MTLTYAIGDIHGSLDKLRALFARCEAHAAGRPMKLVFLGDYIDRGPESFGVIDFLLTLRKRRGDAHWFCDPEQRDLHFSNDDVDERRRRHHGACRLSCHRGRHADGHLYARLHQFLHL